MAEAKDTKSKTQSPAHGTRHAKPQAHESSGPAPGVDGGATSLVDSLGGDFSEATFERHAALLGDSRFSIPANSGRRAQVVQQLQRDYGNAYVQRLAGHVMRSKDRRSDIDSIEDGKSTDATVRGRQLMGSEGQAADRSAATSLDVNREVSEAQVQQSIEDTNFNTDFAAANLYCQNYINTAQSSVSAMLAGYLAAEKEVKRIMSLKDPESIWKAIALTALTVAISAIPGAGIISSRLVAITAKQGGFFAKALETTAVTIATKVATYGLTLQVTPPSISAKPGPLGQIMRTNTAVQYDISLINQILVKWREAYESSKKRRRLIPWTNNLKSLVAGQFEPVALVTAQQFQDAFERMLAEQAIRKTVQARVARTYDFYSGTLSRATLKALVTGYGWTVPQICGWGGNWSPPYAPWNWYSLAPGEQP